MKRGATIDKILWEVIDREMWLFCCSNVVIYGSWMENKLLQYPFCTIELYAIHLIIS